MLHLSREYDFDRCAIAPVEEIAAGGRLREWLARGMHGSMQWMERTADKRADPRRVLEGARAIIVVAVNYHTERPTTEDPQQGCISRYAWGAEYHDFLGERLAGFQDALLAAFPAARALWYVDTGPVLEKAWAERAGLGWIGKHTNVINRDLGSWIFLGAVVTDLELAASAPHGDYCGSCTACIDVCPTDAIVAPYVLDARLCISYLTIENRGPIPRHLRAAIGNRVFGCDDCQDVCPWNRFAHESARARAFDPYPGNAAPDLVELLQLDAQAFRERFRGSPVLRAKHRGFLRNVAVALGNSGERSAVPALVERLEDREALVRAHVAWALGRLGGAAAHSALRARLAREQDPAVAREIEAALADEAA